jgi:hypothetical protein
MGNTVYDWSPFFSAINNGIQQASQRAQYNDAINGLIGQQGINPVTVTPKVPEGTAKADLAADPARQAAYNMPFQSFQPGLIGQGMGADKAQAMATALKNMPPAFGMGSVMPLLLKTALTPTEYDTTPRTGVNPATGKAEQFVMGKNGQPHWLGLAAREGVKIAPNGQAYNEFDTQPGTSFADQGKPFDPVTGASNPNVQGYEMGLRRAGATNVAVNSENSFGGAVAKNLADQFTGTRDKAQSAASAIAAVNEARGLLQSGMYTGQLAPFQLLAAKLGIVDDPQRIANTEAFQSAMGKQTFSLIKQLGSGTAISNSDREYADKVAGAKITLNQDSLAKILDINERANRELIKQYNAQAQKVGQSPAMRNVPMDLMVQEPAPFAPQRQPSRSQQQAAPQQSQPVRVSTPEEALRLPPGTRFVTPDGRMKVRP